MRELKESNLVTLDALLALARPSIPVREQLYGLVALCHIVEVNLVVKAGPSV
jgi:hypothetical protein